MKVKVSCMGEFPGLPMGLHDMSSHAQVINRNEEEFTKERQARHAPLSLASHILRLTGLKT